MRLVLIVYVIYCVVFVLLVHYYGDPDHIYVAAKAAIDAYFETEPLTRVRPISEAPTVTYF